ncbi:MAG: CTP synthase [Candidatus Pacebacteria bacterium]|nr:CTP synthase [Candidatus Paceibacterota bacterium]
MSKSKSKVKAPKSNHKYIFVLGGVMSGVGKGVTTASIAKILSARGFKVNPMKIDPYLNVDAGTMNPIEHGEVFVLDSGLECDQDMGNYERFLDLSVPPENYMTSGMVYKYVIDKERALGYGGKCVDPVPYISGEILRRMRAAREKTRSDITIVEIGGTVGEYQNALFIESARILKLKNPDDVIFVLVSYLPVPDKIGEMKTKPTQYAVRSMNSYGVHPDIIIARSDRPLDKSRKEKIAFSSNVPPENIISAPDVDSIYDIPLNFEKDKLSDILLKLLKTKPKSRDLNDWRRMVARVKGASDEVKIGIVGKYFKTGDFVLSDVYISIIESLKHAGAANKVKVKLEWLDAGDYEDDAKKLAELESYDGVLVPGGFGERGVEGKIAAIRYARERQIPYFGLCYGMQLAVIEFARHVAELKGAHTTEVNPKTSHPVIDIMADQKEKMAQHNYGGTMRLGAYPAVLKKGTIAYSAYGTGKISERHRHRYEVNPEYIKLLTEAGLTFSGTSPDTRLMEIAELPKEIHPFFLGTQFHPEFKSTPLNPHPLFREFVKAAKNRSGK